MLNLISDDTFQEKVREVYDPILVMFTGNWCQPCKRFKPVVEEYLGSAGSGLTGYQADMEVAENTADELNIRSLPALVLFVDGMIRDVHSGTMTKEQLQLWVQDNI